MTYAELIKRIKKANTCRLIRHGANHDVWINLETDAYIIIPRHRSKEVPSGTAKAILKQAGIYL